MTAVITIDAAGRAPGRVATEAAIILRGKHKTDFVPHMITGDRVRVINAGKLKFTGKKLEQKVYIHHTMHPGGLRRTSMKKVYAINQGEVLRRAVYNMLPKNKLRPEMMKRLMIEA